MDKGRALVLGGGGVTGIAWGLGFLMGLLDEGLDLRDADLIVGTSAGSSVGAQITTTAEIDGLYAKQLEPSSEQAMAFDAEALNRLVTAAIAEVGFDAQAIRQRLVLQRQQRTRSRGSLMLGSWRLQNRVVRLSASRPGEELPSPLPASWPSKLVSCVCSCPSSLKRRLVCSRTA